MEQGLLEPEQAGSPLLIKELKKTFWGFAQHLDMNGSGRITPELSQELLERMNQVHPKEHTRTGNNIKKP